MKKPRYSEHEQFVSTLNQLIYFGIVMFPLTLLAGWLPWKPEISTEGGISLVAASIILAFLSVKAVKRGTSRRMKMGLSRPLDIAIRLFALAGMMFPITFLPYLFLYRMYVFFTATLPGI